MPSRLDFMPETKPEPHAKSELFSHQLNQNHASRPRRLQELENWLLHTGISPTSSMSVSWIGIYTDFT